MPTPERLVLACSVIVNDYKVREKTGRNDGEWVAAFLDQSAGLPEGYAWCASMIDFACEVAGIAYGPFPAAAVIQWTHWGKANHRIVKTPVRGALAFKMFTGTTGHIGCVTSEDVAMHTVSTLEGNTSAGSAGSQRDGGGAYKRIRPATFWDGYIVMSENGK